MKNNPYPPLNPKSFEGICRGFSEVILRQESGTWICPPLSAPYRTITQFQEDTTLQKKLFGKAWGKYMFLNVDLKQKEKISKEDLYSSIKEALIAEYYPYIIDKERSLLEIIDMLIQKEEKIIVVFAEGIDQMIRNGDWSMLDELAFLAQRNWQTHILLFTETLVTHPDYFQQFCKRTTLSQNITFFSRYDPSEQTYFMKYLSHNWHIAITTEQKRWIDENCGGHFLFIKEAFRQIAKNPKISFEELDNAAAFALKAEAVFNNFHPDAQNIFIAIAKNEQIPDSLHKTRDMLLSLGWIEKREDKLVCTIPYFSRFIQTRFNKTKQVSVAHMLTRIEQNVYNYLTTHSEKIVTREELAKAMWDEAWETKYSDWAIDQLTHSLRKKLKDINDAYHIITKKGQGFIFSKN